MNEGRETLAFARDAGSMPLIRVCMKRDAAPPRQTTRPCARPPALVGAACRPGPVRTRCGPNCLLAQHLSIAFHLVFEPDLVPKVGFEPTRGVSLSGF